jgi:hypothetical protein
MPRIRSIHYDACKSEKLQSASAEAERCYWRLLPHCDDEGRAEDDVRFLRSEMFPIAEPPLPARVVDSWLQELDRLGLIHRYVVDGRRYLVVTRWHDYQKPQHAKDSVLPAPDCTSHEEERTPHEDDSKTFPGEGVGVVVGEGVGEGGELVLAAPDRILDPLDAVFFAWQQATGHTRAVLDEKRRQCIRKALKRYPPGDLIAACQGVVLFPHNRGETNGTRYDDITLVLRDSEHIERFRDRYRGEDPPAPRMPKGSDMTARNLARMENPNGTS